MKLKFERRFALLLCLPLMCLSGPSFAKETTASLEKTCFDFKINHETAISACTKLIEQTSAALNLSKYYSNRADHLREIDKFAESLQDSEKAIAATPKRAQPYVAKASTLSYMNKFGESKTLLEDILDKRYEMDTTLKSRIYSDLGIVTGDLGDESKAIEFYNKSIAINSKIFKLSTIDPSRTIF